MALKFLRDGIAADNIVAMPNMTGINSWNFFEEPMSNRVAAFDPAVNPIEDATIRKKMTEAVGHVFVTAVGDIATWNADQTPVADSQVSIPYELLFSSPTQFPAEK